MAQMTLMVFHIEGDAAEISAAMDVVRQELGRIASDGKAKQQIEVSRVSVPVVAAAESVPAVERHATRKVTPPSDGKMPQHGSLQEKAWEIIRNSQYGVTSEEIQKAIDCATVQSAYQMCLELQKKGLVERTPAGAWKKIAK